MPTLSDPRLGITVASGTPNATVTASVDVSFSATEKTLISLLSLSYKVTCRIRGADSGLTGGDNALFTLGNVMVHNDRNNIPFTRVVNRDMLDEDTGSRTKFMHDSFASTCGYRSRPHFGKNGRQSRD